jgi:hypothetical protein
MFQKSELRDHRTPPKPDHIGERRSARIHTVLSCCPTRHRHSETALTQGQSLNSVSSQLPVAQQFAQGRQKVSR